jgi:hypothetical protein
VRDGAVEPLIQALRDPAPLTRWRAAEALGKIADRRALYPLVRALRDQRSRVRQEAAGALYELVESEQDRKALRRVARGLWWRLTDDWEVGDASYKALATTVARLTVLKVETLGEDCCGGWWGGNDGR